MVASVATERQSRVRRFARTVRVAYWLGWQIESNWTDPVRFLIYSLMRPISAVLILFVMFKVVIGATRGPFLDFLVVGSALWPFVFSGIQGMGYAVISDREHHRTTRYIATMPVPYGAYLAGRAAAQSTSAAAAALVTLALGRVVLGLEMSLPLAMIPYFVVTLALGMLAIVGLGYLLVSLLLSMSGEGWRLPEAVGLSLYLISGTIFPVTVLPGWLQVVARAHPLSWWLEASRRALLGPRETESFPAYSDLEVLGILTLLSLLTVTIGWRVFRMTERRARALGVLDRESAF